MQQVLLLILYCVPSFLCMRLILYPVSESYIFEVVKILPHFLNHFFHYLHIPTALFIFGGLSNKTGYISLEIKIIKKTHTNNFTGLIYCEPVSYLSGLFICCKYIVFYDQLK